MALALASILLLVQEPPDDVGPRFHQIPPTREWEVAEAYYRKIAAALRASDYGTARLWDRRARDRTTPPYADRLAELGREFWGQLKDPGVEIRALRFALALAPGTPADAKRLPKTAGHFGSHLSLALSLACEGSFDEAGRLLEDLGRDHPGEQRDLQRIQDTLLLARDPSDAAGSTEAFLSLASRAHSAGAGFKVLSRILAQLKEPAGDAVRRRLEAAALDAFRSLGDHAGARALETEFLRRAGRGAEADAKSLLERARAAYQRQDFAAAADAYRELLKRQPESGSIAEWLFSLGSSLRRAGKPVEGRVALEQLGKLDGKGTGREEHAVAHYQERAAFEIAACLEAELRFTEALEAYAACADRDDRLALEIFERMQRCRIRLGRTKEALLAYEKAILEEKEGFPPPTSAAYVDLAIQLDAFEQAEKAARGVTSAAVDVGAYIRVLKLRQARDVMGLFDLASDLGRAIHLSGRSWEELRAKPETWLLVEIVDCIAELGDRAIDHLAPRVRLELGHDQLALVALGRVRTDRSRALLADPEWTRSIPRDRLEQSRRLSADPPRARRRLAELPPAAPDPAEDAKRKEAAAKIRERLAELAGKVKGIENLLSAGTEEGRIRALGETILAWKKGTIVDEDFGDLVALALEEKWTLARKTLFELVRDHRAAPAGPLVAPYLDSGDPEVRAQAAQVLGTAGARAYADRLRRLLEDTDERVRAAARQALAQFDERKGRRR